MLCSRHCHETCGCLDRPSVLWWLCKAWGARAWPASCCCACACKSFLWTSMWAASAAAWAGSPWMQNWALRHVLPLHPLALAMHACPPDPCSTPKAMFVNGRCAQQVASREGHWCALARACESWRSCMLALVGRGLHTGVFPPCNLYIAPATSSPLFAYGCGVAVTICRLSLMLCELAPRFSWFVLWLLINPGHLCHESHQDLGLRHTSLKVQLLSPPPA